jgi:hypothetical protein
MRPKKLTWAVAMIVGNTIILNEEPDIDARLFDVFGTTRDDLLAIVWAAVGAKNDSVPDDPINAGGLFAYIFGTRGVRVLFRAKGWVIDRTDNIESVIHPDTGVRVIYQNTDTAAELFHSPKAISSKGSASERMVEMAYLFPEWERERLEKLELAKKRENATVWFLCVAVTDAGVWAEISRPRAIENNQFGEWIERIFLIQGGGGAQPQPKFGDDNLPEQEFEINVSRK